jgi:site-specific recombinase XerD
LTDEEIEKIIESINPNNVVGARLHAMVLLLLDSGLRISELAEARMSHLDLQRRQLRVIGKGEKERMVPFGTRCAQAILKYINLYRRW